MRCSVEPMRSALRLMLTVMAAGLLVLPGREAAAQVRETRPGPPPRLNLTSEQQDKLRRLMRETVSRLQDAREQDRDARKNLFQQLADYKLDEQRVRQAVRRINKLQTRRLDAQLENQIKLRRILTREQFQALRQAIGHRGPFRGEFGFLHGDVGAYGGDVERIGLSPEQQEQIKALWKKSRQTTAALRDRLSTDSQNLEKLYLEYDLDAKLAKQRIDRLSETHLDVLNAMVSRQTELRKILTEEQFRALAKEVPPPHFRTPGPGPRPDDRKFHGPPDEPEPRAASREEHYLPSRDLISASSSPSISNTFSLLVLPETRLT